MKLYLAISPDVHEGMVLFEFPEGLVSPLPTGIKVDVTGLEPVNAFRFSKGLEGLSGALNELKLSVECRHNFEGTALGELKIGKVFVESIGGLRTYYTNSELLEYPEPEVLFKWDKELMDSKYSLAFLTGLTAASTALLVSLLDDGTRLISPLSTCAHPSSYVAVAHVNCLNEYMALSRAQPLMEGKRDLLREVGRYLASLSCNQVEVEYVKDVNVDSLDAFTGRLKRSVVDVLFLIPKPTSYPLLYYIDKSVGVEGFFSYGFKLVNVKELKRMEPLPLFFNLKERLGSITERFEDDYLQANSRSLVEALTPPLIYGKGKGGPSPPSTFHKPLNLEGVLKDLREGEKIAVIYSFYGRSSLELALFAKIRSLLPPPHREKPIKYLIKIKGLRLFRELNRLRIEGRYDLNMKFLLSSPPFPSEILLIERGERLSLMSVKSDL